MATRHTLSVLVEDKPGVLARVASLFSRRGFNIESLAVGPTEHPTTSRMTIVVSVEDLPLEQVTKQLNKLVNVLKIVELEASTSVQRELLLVKVKADLTTRSHVLETVQLFRAKVVDVARGSGRCDGHPVVRWPAERGVPRRVARGVGRRGHDGAAEQGAGDEQADEQGAGARHGGAPGARAVAASSQRRSGLSPQVHGPFGRG